MTNKIIFDAWNIIWKMPSLSKLIPDKLEQVRAKFNQIIKNYYYNKHVSYKIVYDGQPMVYSQTQNQNPHVSYSRNPEEADDLIIKFLNKESNPERWTVITSDRYLSHRVKNIGAKIASAESFIAKLNKSVQNQETSDKHKNPQIRHDDISYWLEKFESTN